MDFIAGELDIEVPSLNFNLLDSFLQNSEEAYKNSKSYRDEIVYHERNQRPYPWKRRVLESQGTVLHNYRNLDLFKPIVNLIDSFPIAPFTRVILLISQSNQPDYDFNYHFDRDDTYGFRICFGLDTSKTFLELAELKTEFRTHGENLGKIENYMVKGPIYSIRPMKSNTVMCLPGKKYPHRVPVNNSGARCVLIVRGNLISLDGINFLQKVKNQ